MRVNTRSKRGISDFLMSLWYVAISQPLQTSSIYDGAFAPTSDLGLERRAVPLPFSPRILVASSLPLSLSLVRERGRLCGGGEKEREGDGKND